MSRWSVGKYDTQRRGTWQLGMTLWGNEGRFGGQLNLWRWEFQITKERR